MTKDLSKMYKVRSASSTVIERPTDNMNDTVKEMFLLDDILKMKGHPKSKDLKNEKPYSELDRTALIIELMGINTERKKGRWTYISLLMEVKKWHKSEMRGEADAFRHLREIRFNERLQQVIPITEPKPLYKGKGNIIFNESGDRAFAYIKKKKLVSLFPEKVEETGMPIKIGEISESAIREITNRSWPVDRLFDIVEERKEVPFEVFCDLKAFKGWKTRRKYSDVKRQIRVVINGCRY